MPTSEARILANQANAQRSTGPKTDAGKERSRQNSLKHGLTGAGIVLPEADAAKVERLTIAFAEELSAIGEVGQSLARLAALNSVRVERAADQETAALTARVRQVAADFVPPEGVDDDEAAQLRDEAVRISMFDPSKEAILARRYQANAERGFYKAIKLLRQMDKEADALLKADDEARANDLMGSFLKMQREGREIDAGLDAMEARLDEMDRMEAARPRNSAQFTPVNATVDVPFTIGRSR